MFEFSIIIPTYGRSESLKRTLNSVEYQQFRNFECIVIDDNPKKSQLQLKNQQMLQSSFPTFKYLLNTNQKGACGARNSGILHSNGRFLIFLDDDDELLPNHLTVVVNNCSKIDLIFTQCEIFEESKRIGVTNNIWKEDQDSLKQQIIIGVNSTSSLIIKREKIESIGGWEEIIIGQENLLVTKLMLAGARVKSLSDVTCRIYYGSDTRISDKTNEINLKAFYQKLHEIISLGRPDLVDLLRNKEKERRALFANNVLVSFPLALALLWDNRDVKSIKFIVFSILPFKKKIVKFYSKRVLRN